MDQKFSLIDEFVKTWDEKPVGTAAMVEVIKSVSEIVGEAEFPSDPVGCPGCERGGEDVTPVAVAESEVDLPGCGLDPSVVVVASEASGPGRVVGVDLFQYSWRKSKSDFPVLG